MDIVGLEHVETVVSMAKDLVRVYRRNLAFLSNKSESGGKRYFDSLNEVYETINPRSSPAVEVTLSDSEVDPEIEAGVFLFPTPAWLWWTWRCFL